jgi:hypothetical protein
MIFIFRDFIDLISLLRHLSISLLGRLRPFIKQFAGRLRNTKAIGFLFKVQGTWHKVHGLRIPASKKADI